MTFRMSNSRTGKDKDKSSVTNTFNTMPTYDAGETALFSAFLEENVCMLFADVRPCPVNVQHCTTINLNADLAHTYDTVCYLGPLLKSAQNLGYLHILNLTNMMNYMTMRSPSPSHLLREYHPRVSSSPTHPLDVAQRHSR
jgi:hypothetical protein